MTTRMATTGQLRAREPGGSALIAVLWTLGLLSMFITSFAFDAHIEARITSYYRKRAKADYLARSGVEIAKMLMVKSHEVSADAEGDPEDRWFDNAKRLKEGASVQVEEELGEGKVTVRIVSEKARRNVNLLKTEEDWEGVLDVGGVPEDMWPQLIDPVMDWMDADMDARPGDGAETDDYYATLDPPSRAKDGPLDTVGELLLVKSFKPAVLYGGILNKDAEGEDPIVLSGIADLLTVYGSEKVNVNAASARVLETLPEVDELIAGAIVEERRGYEGEGAFFKDDGDLFSRFPELNSGATRKYITTAEESYYRITAVGEAQGVRKEVWCIVRFDAAKKNLAILRWREQD